ncbi:MAG: hypothetical protein COU63_00180 [Candidatus Pacebacteria bacterium CG10_big_fil_rev_8_21_14_0_10_36_11]|nr:hypothetical protein [Candidatus Pacearchaeota archaeon]OIP74175.1 MAG: hypothetical protein AUK08_02930 [Candidatus Pacebacteria bacterium CG2_30_36_39]PIR65078.1 MAG: hypothetical protein COU63_00180 [Candidatus Pacebacteria bacterium CG10_big_fil_rev_8_21_14_0_10_36_11]PJC42422.1 MAG: hypothetical protein CO040_04650 [Candidatus Pacebacteria bacterium CG_4_9_14_0_2_um_filter_36_8]
MINRNTPLFISLVGQTATGKTEKALSLANKLHQQFPNYKIALISADSKQVFSELAILTGADIPKNWLKKKNDSLTYQYFAHQKLPITLHGTSILTGDKEWSVGHFHNLVINLVANLTETIFIIVGGTGLYHQQIYQPAATLHQQPNEKLRTELETKTLEELQNQLIESDPNKLIAMNNSDLNNPRRLIRAIEISLSPKDNPKNNNIKKIIPTIQIGLTTENLEEKIALRVKKRIEQQVIEEIKNFEKNYSTENLIAKASLGYQEINQYLKNEIDQEKMIELWTTSEIQYARRQMTWWKKQTQITWQTAEEFSIELIINKILEN